MARAAGIVNRDGPGDDRAFAAILTESPAHVQRIARAARDLIYAEAPGTVEVVWPRQRSVGWGTGPKKMSEQFAYLMPFTRHVTLGFYDGSELADPTGLLPSSSANKGTMRSLKLTSVDDLERDDVRALVRAASRHRLPPPTPGAGAMAAAFGPAAGSWSGTSAFRLMPTDELQSAPSTAHLTTASDGHALVLTYRWVHPTDGAQDGVLLVGSPGDDRHDGDVTAAWSDGWHQKPALTTLSGRVSGRRLELETEYGGGWRWTIELDAAQRDELTLTMHNVVPPEYATDEAQAGPYPVMVASLRRA